MFSTPTREYEKKDTYCNVGYLVEFHSPTVVDWCSQFDRDSEGKLLAQSEVGLVSRKHGA